MGFILLISPYLRSDGMIFSLSEAFSILPETLINIQSHFHLVVFLKTTPGEWISLGCGEAVAACEVQKQGYKGLLDFTVCHCAVGLSLGHVVWCIFIM